MAKGDSYKGLYTYLKEKKQDEIPSSFNMIPSATILGIEGFAAL